MLRPGEVESGSLRVGVSGILSLDTVTTFRSEMDGLIETTSAASMTFDLGDLEYLDSTGALALVLARDRAARRSIPVRITGMSAEAGRVPGIIADDTTRAAAPKQQTSSTAWTRLQDVAARLSDRMDLLCLFVGDVASALAASKAMEGISRQVILDTYLAIPGNGDAARGTQSSRGLSAR